MTQKIVYIHRLNLIHQTDVDCAEKIISTQKFIPSANGFFGPGVYFANTIEATNMKSSHRSTYLIADVYIGKAYSVDADEVLNGKFNYQSIKLNGFNSIIGFHMPTGREIVIFDPDRIKNIKYIYGTRPQSFFNSYRNRVVLFFLTDSNRASQIVLDQKIPKTKGPLGNFITLYDTISDAQAINNGETFLAADCDVRNIYVHNKKTAFNCHCLPYNWKCFKVMYNGALIYGFRHHNMIAGIHYCGGKTFQKKS